MILANLRERLTAADLSFVVELLAQGDEGLRRKYEFMAAERGRDYLLDQPGLFDLMKRASGLVSPSAPLFFYVAVRDALRAIGVDDAELSDYLGALLLEFAVRDRAYRIAPADDATYYYIADIVADLEVVSGKRGFLLRAHLGNFSLWLAGVFPDYVTARMVRRGGPDFSYYDEMGARGFRLAADHVLAREWNLAPIYSRAADSFEALRVALNRLSDDVFFRNFSNPDRLMRQVRDEMRFPSRRTIN
ncbi:MAG: hypothetical protein KatS3mg081_1149 [Gemmatimonadales bacterium]|nr:MAG: hypothetical protein KatS3mg081_1149 [Gemmatimonadales bacterium]